MGILRRPNYFDTVPMQCHDAETALITRPYPGSAPLFRFNPSQRSVQATEVVYLVDGDAEVRREISSFLMALEIRVITFASAAEYLECTETHTAACVILSLHLPDLDGLELQRRLARKGNPPAIFISGQCDIASTVCAMKAGAIEFLTKPLDLAALLEAIATAFAQDRRVRQQKAELASLQERFSTLTPREREVLPLIVGGLLNKQAASVLGITAFTVQVHRAQVMRKMRAQSFADLVRMASKLSIRGIDTGRAPTMVA
jgi:FixJ family two-component response regulator